MIACDKCDSEENVVNVTVRVLSETASGDATGELCPVCREALATAISDAGIPLELAVPTNRGLGASN